VTDADYAAFERMCPDWESWGEPPVLNPWLPLDTEDPEWIRLKALMT
jgi:hypothetical protein